MGLGRMIKSQDYQQGNISLEEFKDSMFILTTEKLDWQEVRDIVEEEMGYYPKKETQLVHNAVRIKQGKYNF